MKTKQKIAYFLIAAISSLMLFSQAKAIVPTTISLSNTTGDAVRVDVAGNPNSAILLSFLPPGAPTVTTIAFGTTDGTGNFTTSISSGGYGIPAGSPAFASINGLQSTTLLWPSYSSSLTLSQTSAQIAIGQSVAISASSALILSSNSLSSSIATTISGSQITITGITTGSGAITLCSANVGCGSIAVAIGEQAGQTQITFNQNNIVLNNKQTQNISVYGGSRNGYTISSNSNTTAVVASVSGSSNVVSLYGNDTPGTAIIVVCSVDNNTNCANLNATTLSNIVSALSFSQNNISLIPGLTQNITVSGGTNNSYYISSNSNSGVAQATLSGNTITLVGGSNTGSTIIAVCSTTTNAICGNLNASLTATPTAASPTVVAFSQNVVTIAQGDTTIVTISGGGNAGYVISSNSNPTAVTANINNNTNIINLYGNAIGSAIVSVCSTTTGTTCASLYITVGEPLLPILFSQNNIALASGGKSIITITGGNGTGRTISSISNPNTISATLSADGNVLVLTGGTAPGSATITVCSATYTNNCANLSVTVSAPIAVAPTTINNTTKTTAPAKPIAKPATNKTTKVLGVSAYKFTKLLKSGIVDKEVKELQKVLNKLGYFTNHVFTNFFGAITKNAVIAFQKAKGLKPYPGWVGPGTRDALNKISQ